MDAAKARAKATRAVPAALAPEDPLDRMQWARAVATRFLDEAAARLRAWAKEVEALHAALEHAGKLEPRDRVKLNRLLRDFLGLEPTDENLRAFWRALRRPNKQPGRPHRWREIEPQRLQRWLSSAVLGERRKLRDAWKRDGWRPKRERRAGLVFHRTGPAAPRDLQAEREAIARLREDASDRDLRILAIAEHLAAEGFGPRNYPTEQGFLASEVVHRLGITWPQWQAFQRKAQRRKKSPPPMARKRRSAG